MVNLWKQTQNRVRKFYPFAGRKSPYVIMSAEMAEADYIKYANEYGSRNRFPGGSRVWKILLVSCICLSITALLQQCISLEKYYEGQGKSGGVAVEEIVIISKESRPEQSYPAFPSRTQDVNELRQICEPKSTKMQACNTCTCDEAGQNWACTKMFCQTAGNQLDLNIGAPME